MKQNHATFPNAKQTETWTDRQTSRIALAYTAFYIALRR